MMHLRIASFSKNDEGEGSRHGQHVFAGNDISDALQNTIHL